MAKYRKLSRTSSQRKALIRGQVTALIANGKIVTTEAKAKEIRKVAEGLIAAAVREKDNFDEVTVTAKVARKDADGKRVKEVVDGKKVTVYDEVEKKIKKDQPSRLHARREMLKVLYTVKTNDGTKKGAKEVDLVAKLFDEIAPKYADRNGGYTRIVPLELQDEKTWAPDTPAGRLWPAAGCPPGHTSASHPEWVPSAAAPSTMSMRKNRCGAGTGGQAKKAWPV